MAYTKKHSEEAYLKLVAQIVSEYKQQTYEMMKIRAGHKIIDVGCGPGTDTISLAQLVGDRGEIIGVDTNKAFLELADQNANKAKVSTWVKHKEADATALPFDTGYFDSSRSERLFQHLNKPEKALSEMIRVTKSDGWIVVLDTDWSTMSIDTDEIEIEQRLKRFHVEQGFNNGYIGRRLNRLFKMQDLLDISIKMAPIYSNSYMIARQAGMLDETEKAALIAGVISSEELKRWNDSLEKADAEGVFFSTIIQVIVAGRKP
jgi:ubiquinone/menaquinone biosynthesis C-methylase UbiE